MDRPTTLLFSGDVNACTPAAAKNNEKQETFMIVCIVVIDCEIVRRASTCNGNYLGEGEMSWFAIANHSLIFEWCTS